MVAKRASSSASSWEAMRMTRASRYRERTRGAVRVVREEGPDAPSRERPSPVAGSLELGGERQHCGELIRGEIGDRQEGALRRHSRRVLGGVNLAAGV